LSDADDPAGVVAAFRDTMAPGSYLVVSHASPGSDAARTEEAARLYRQSTAGLTLRTPEQVAAFFDGFSLLPPGVVPAARWRRRGRGKPAPVLAAVGQLPGYTLPGPPAGDETT
jgi:hypothetical protein